MMRMLRRAGMAGSRSNGRRFRPRPEPLEGRALLNASIDVDADGRVTVDMTDAAPYEFRVSVAGGVYTFASDAPIDVAGDPAGLVESGAGTTTVAVGGVSRLTLLVGGLPVKQPVIASVDVETSVEIRSEGRVILGDEADPAGLTALTGHVTVTGAGDSMAYLSLIDAGSTRTVDYTFGADAFDATGGFGGVSFSGLYTLDVYGAGTAAGGAVSVAMPAAPSIPVSYFKSNAQVGVPTHFLLDSGDAATSSINLIGGLGPNTFDVERTPTWTFLGSSGGPSVLNLGDDGSTAGIRSKVGVNSWNGAAFEVFIDDSAGTAPRAATLKAMSTLSGFGGGDSILEFLGGAPRRMVYKAPRGQANSLLVDLTEGDAWGSSFEYDGGGDGATGAYLTLLGAGGPYSGYTGESYTAVASGVGYIDLTRTWGRSAQIVFSGLAPDGLTDLVKTPEYRLNYIGGADPALFVTDAAVGGTQALRIASGAATPAFTSTRIANKGAVTIATNGIATTTTLVIYASPLPVPGLESLTIITSPNDDVPGVSTPPGVAFVVETTAPPRPIPAPPESTVTPPTTVDPIDPVSPAPAVPVDPTPVDPVDPTPIDPTPAVPAGLEVQSGEDVGADRLARFGAAMRTSSGPRPVDAASSPFRRLREARLARLAGLRLRRLERLHALHDRFR